MLLQYILFNHMLHHFTFRFANELSLLLYKRPQSIQLLFHLRLVRTLLFVYFYLPAYLSLSYSDLLHLVSHLFQLLWHVYVHLTDIHHALV